MSGNLIQEKSFKFALEIIELYRLLVSEREFILSKQLLRSGTSIGANIEEALGGQSRKDFLYKLYISLKEARETRYWLKLLMQSQITNIDYTEYLIEIESIINILLKIIKTTSSNP